MTLLKLISRAAFPLLLVCAALSSGLALRAAEIAASGSATLARAPTVMRMQVELRASAASLSEALAELKKARQTVEKRLLELGAAKDALKFDATKSISQDDPQGQMELAVRSRLARSGRSPVPGSQPAASQAATVSATLTAEWPLKDEESETRLVSLDQLQKKIKAALAKTSSSAPLSAEEAEAAEEASLLAAAAAAEVAGEDGEPQPGMPTFAFVYRLTEKETSKATAEAFDNARKQASQLASAAGLKLGSLKQLASGPPTGDENMYNYYRGYAARMQWMAMQQRQESDSRELLGPDSSGVSGTISVSATFQAE
jgi:uncharacterized protein YggE